MDGYSILFNEIEGQKLEIEVKLETKINGSIFENTVRLEDSDAIDFIEEYYPNTSSFIFRTLLKNEYPED